MRSIGSNVQREQFQRLGITGDWDNPYLTMDFQAEATIVSELFKFAESGQVYRGAKPVMWSPVEKTALAEAEIEYEDITSTQIDVAFEIVESPIPGVGRRACGDLDDDAVDDPGQPRHRLRAGRRVRRSIAKLTGHRHGRPRRLGWRDSITKMRWVSSSSRENCCNSSGSARLPETGHKIRIERPDDLPVIWSGIGSELAGTIARHPMHKLGGFFARPRPFLPGDFVTTDQGTGLVHMAPDHGEDDFELCKANGIDPVFAVEGDGKYRADWLWLGGQGSVINNKFNAPDGPICTDLREAGALLAASADFQHSYPHSWRSKAKVIYRCTPQWFVAMDRPLPSYHCETLRRAALGQ